MSSVERRMPSAERRMQIAEREFRSAVYNVKHVPSGVASGWGDHLYLGKLSPVLPNCSVVSNFFRVIVPVTTDQKKHLLNKAGSEEELSGVKRLYRLF